MLVTYRTSLDYALHYGTSTCFYRDRMSDVAQALASQGFFMSREFADSGSKFQRMDPFLQRVLLDVTSVTCLFNMDHAGLKVDPNMLQEVIVSVGCRLVRFHPLGGPQLESKLEAACHIGLIAFTTTLFLQFGRRRFLKYGLVAQRLKEVIDREMEEEDDDVMLWLLFIGGISILAEVDQAWLISRIHTVIQTLGIKDWPALHGYLVQLPWINSLYDETGKSLWDLVMRRQTEYRK